MDFIALKEKIKIFQMEDVRINSTESYEFVIRSDHLNSLCKVFEAFFGPPLKPAEEKPKHHEEIKAEPYGGIRIGQTMYYASEDNVFSIVLLWPWNNGECTTVKIFSNQPLAV